MLTGNCFPLISGSPSGVNLVWNLGGRGYGSTKFRIFQANKKINFPGKNCSFTATFGQIILFLYKSHHFWTYFLYMIRYNNISRPVHDHPATRPTALCPKSGEGRDTPTSRIDAPVRDVCVSYGISRIKLLFIMHYAPIRGSRQTSLAVVHGL